MVLILSHTCFLPSLSSLGSSELLEAEIVSFFIPLALGQCFKIFSNKEGPLNGPYAKNYHLPEVLMLNPLT